MPKIASGPRIFQPLENRQVIPFRSRNILSIGRVSARPELDRSKMREHSQNQNHDESDNRIHHHLSRIETLRRQLRLDRILARRPSRTGFAE